MLAVIPSSMQFEVLLYVFKFSYTSQMISNIPQVMFNILSFLSRVEVSVKFRLFLRQFLFLCFYCSSTVVSIFLPTTLPNPSHPHLPPPILPTLGFVHVSFIVVPKNPSPCSPHSFTSFSSIAAQLLPLAAKPDGLFDSMFLEYPKVRKES